MKLNEAIILTEAKFSSPSIMFHGTSSKHLRSILSQGLHDRNLGSGYGSGVSGSAYNRDMTAIGGVYLTASLRVAQSAASSSTSSNENSVIVVTSVQPESGYADEDDIDILVKEAIGRQMSSMNALMMYAENKYRKKNHADILLDRLPMRIGALLDKQPGVDNLMNEMLQAFLARNLAYDLRNPSQAFMSHPKYLLADELNIRDPEAIDQAFEQLLDDIGSPQEAERRYRKVLERLTIALKRFAYDKGVNVKALSTTLSGSSLRVPTGIGFKGNNKIVSIIEVDDASRSFLVHYDRGIASQMLNEMQRLFGDYEMRGRS